MCCRFLEAVLWFEVLALRSMGIKEASDQRILGDGTFVGQLLEEIDDMGRENLKLTTRQMYCNWGHY